jgi:hypothetical protein
MTLTTILELSSPLRVVLRSHPITPLQHTCHLAVHLDTGITTQRTFVRHRPGSQRLATAQRIQLRTETDLQITGHLLDGKLSASAASNLNVNCTVKEKI